MERDRSLPLADSEICRGVEVVAINLRRPRHGTWAEKNRPSIAEVVPQRAFKAGRIDNGYKAASQIKAKLCANSEGQRIHESSVFAARRLAADISRAAQKSLSCFLDGVGF